jgi:UDP-N-acetylglucosamine--N-acetylmuramyl-(pentapeptide) pyrophosphoryl-undecaprenol N-acetylglucosamine transferase
MKRIVLTGGGTAGHVTPNIALLPRLRAADYDISYIGSLDGIEKKLIQNQGIPYYGIASGKLRRYFDVKNFTDPFRVLKGFSEASHLMKELHPDVVFSKGGFVSVPVVMAARKHHIPVICHESDLTPGLANKLSMPSATKVCCNFPETLKYLPVKKAVLTGCPIRKELLEGDPSKAYAMTGFTPEKPVLMVMGGSLGSVAVNQAVRGALPELLKNYQIIHLCGKGKLDDSLVNTTGYLQYEYIQDELADLFAICDLVISRAGANAICELLALKKPALLIPLPSKASRGDQILNAKSFESQGFSMVLQEEDLTKQSLLDAVNHLSKHRQDYIKAMDTCGQNNAIDMIFQLLEEAVRS